MSADPTLTEDESRLDEAVSDRRVLALVILACPEEPARVGEVALLGRNPSWTLGRGDDRSPPPRLTFVRQRPGLLQPRPPLQSRKLSREQAVLTVHGDQLEVENRGRATLKVDGAPHETAKVRPGAVLSWGRQLTVLVTRRSTWIRDHGVPQHPFGQPDAFGIVGEAPCVWELRRQIAYIAARRAHVLVRGPSGTGKELVARAVAGDRRIVARNASALPETLVDAELFGHVQDYPTAGMPGRPGLIGEADGGVLFLDELAEMPEALQTRLLRVLDEGEYHRLGEATPRKARFRFVGATNRPESAVKFDLLARLPFRVETPGLDEHPEDVPLLARELLGQIAHDDPGALGDAGIPELSSELLRALVQRRWSTHVRELRFWLWRALAERTGSALDAPEDLTLPTRVPAASPPDTVEGGELDPETIQAVLDRCNGVQEKAWRALGLKSRHVLARLIKKHGLILRKRG